MKRLVLFTLALVILASGSAFSQTNNPAVSSAFISPNPVEGKADLIFEEPLSENVSIVVKDLTGKTVYMLRPEIIMGQC